MIPSQLLTCWTDTVFRYYNATVLKFYKQATKLALGVDKPGYLHVSNMKPKDVFVGNCSDILNLKDVIPVRVWRLKGKEVEVGRCSSMLQGVNLITVCSRG